MTRINNNCEHVSLTCCLWKLSSRWHILFSGNVNTFLGVLFPRCAPAPSSVIFLLSADALESNVSHNSFPVPLQQNAASAADRPLESHPLPLNFLAFSCVSAGTHFSRSVSPCMSYCVSVFHYSFLSEKRCQCQPHMLLT
jgi:hypothetical protein